MSLPATKMRPVSGVSSLFISRIIVLLPDPDGPTRKTNSPFWMSALASRRATTSPLYTFVTFSSLIMARRNEACGTRSGTHRVRTLRTPRLPAGPRQLESPPGFRLLSVGRAAAGALPAEVRLDERIEVAVEHAVDVARLVLGAQILHELVRLEHVAADLAAQVDALLLALDLRELGVALLLLDVGEAGLEHRHRPVAVLELAALDLARHHDAGGLVDQAHGRRRLVDVLTTGAGRPEHLHLDV